MLLEEVSLNLLYYVTNKQPRDDKKKKEGCEGRYRIGGDRGCTG